MIDDEEISKYMSQMSKKRRVFRGGFNSEEVQEKIRRIKREKKKEKESKNFSQEESLGGVQPVRPNKRLPKND